MARLKTWFTSGIVNSIASTAGRGLGLEASPNLPRRAAADSSIPEDRGHAPPGRWRAWSGGYVISFTIQSASVPVVETNSW